MNGEAEEEDGNGCQPDVLRSVLAMVRHIRIVAWRQLSALDN